MIVACITTMIASVPGATGAELDEDLRFKDPLPSVGVMELSVLCAMLCVTAIAGWEFMKWIIRSCLRTARAERRLRRLERLKEEVDRAYLAQETRGLATEMESSSSTEERQSRGSTTHDGTRAAEVATGVVAPTASAQRPRTPDLPRRASAAMLVSPGGLSVQSTDTWSDNASNHGERWRVSCDVLALMRCEDLREALRAEGLQTSGLKQNLTERLAERLQEVPDLQRDLPTVRQLKYILWIWRNRNVQGRTHLLWTNVATRQQASQWIGHWRDA